MEFMENTEGKKPFYQALGKGKVYEQEEPLEMERGLMRSYYPQAAGYVQSFVEDACDRLDYEGSFIYDECPDKWMIERTCRGICERIQQHESMQAMDRRGKFLDMDILGELTGALFCQEMCQRRCRRKRCKRFF